MRSNTIICVRWKISGRIEHFTNLGKLFAYYTPDDIEVNRTKLNRTNLFDGYENSTVQIIKTYIK